MIHRIPVSGHGVEVNHDGHNTTVDAEGGDVRVLYEPSLVVLYALIQNPDADTNDEGPARWDVGLTPHQARRLGQSLIQASERAEGKP